MTVIYSRQDFLIAIPLNLFAPEGFDISRDDFRISLSAGSREALFARSLGHYSPGLSPPDRDGILRINVIGADFPPDHRLKISLTTFRPDSSARSHTSIPCDIIFSDSPTLIHLNNGK